MSTASTATMTATEAVWGQGKAATSLPSKIPTRSGPVRTLSAQNLQNLKAHGTREDGDLDDLWARSVVERYVAAIMA